MAENTQGQVPSRLLTSDKQFNSTNGQASTVYENGRMHLLAKATGLANSGTVTAAIAAVAGKALCLQRVIAVPGAAPSGGNLSVTEDPSGAATDLFTRPVQTTDLFIDEVFATPLKGENLGKATNVTFNPGGTLAPILYVYGFFEP